MNENLSKTIQQSRDEMRPLLLEGTTCPCCLQHVQQYRRQLTSAMVYGLIILSKASDNDKTDRGFIHMEDYLKKQKCPSSVRGDLPKARFWGFIEPGIAQADDGNPNAGYYKLLPKGLDFINGKILVQKAVKIYNNKFYGFDGEEIDVWGAIKNKFNYNSLMGIQQYEKTI